MNPVSFILVHSSVHQNGKLTGENLVGFGENKPQFIIDISTINIHRP